MCVYNWHSSTSCNSYFAIYDLYLCAHFNTLKVYLSVFKMCQLGEVHKRTPETLHVHWNSIKAIINKSIHLPCVPIRVLAHF